MKKPILEGGEKEDIPGGRDQSEQIQQTEDEVHEGGDQKKPDGDEKKVEGETGNQLALYEKDLLILDKIESTIWAYAPELLTK